MFIRKKRIKGNFYAYLVRNVWRKRKKESRQKVSKYLGKIYRFENIVSNMFIEFYKIDKLADYIRTKGRKGVVKDLIKLELLNMGFKEEDKVLVNNGLQFNMETLTFYQEGKMIKAVIEMNEGFLCKETFDKIAGFKARGTEEEIGLELGNALLEAGLKVPNEVFVEMVERLSK